MTYYEPGNPFAKVSEASARRGIFESFPEFKIGEIKWISEGNSNVVYRVNNEYAFRFSKDKKADRNLEMEIGILPEIKKAVTVSVPEYEYIGKRQGLRFVGYKFIFGELFTADILHSENRVVRKKCAESFARFIKQLQGISRTKIIAAGVPNNSNKDFYTKQLLDTRKHIYPFFGRACGKQKASILEAYIEELFQRFLLNRRNFTYEPALSYGGLDSNHVIYDPYRKDISGIVDFGGLHMDDPHFDLYRLYRCYGKSFLEEVAHLLLVKKTSHFFEKLEFYTQAKILRRLLRAVLVKDKENMRERLRQLKDITNH